MLNYLNFWYALKSIQFESLKMTKTFGTLLFHFYLKMWRCQLYSLIENFESRIRILIKSLNAQNTPLSRIEHTSIYDRTKTKNIPGHHCLKNLHKHTLGARTRFFLSQLGNFPIYITTNSSEGTNLSSRIKIIFEYLHFLQNIH